MSETENNVLAIVAHPDDAELTCAGTLALLRDKGWKVFIATMTAGDCGSATLSREKISSIRKMESEKAASLIDGEYQCLECNDIFLFYDKPTLLKTISLMRQVKPKLVFTMSPSCYMVDHEMTSKLVQTACFSAGISNIETEDLKPIGFTPHLYYVDPMEGKDKFGNKVVPGTIIDISTKIDIKENMLKCHDSQRSWLKQHHGMDEYLIAMRSYSASVGGIISVPYGEGFRQHLGHAFPQDNLLKGVLTNLAVPLNRIKNLN
jgi:LmbE family N-acetylglucosaminyl deacetylase